MLNYFNHIVTIHSKQLETLATDETYIDMNNILKTYRNNEVIQISWINFNSVLEIVGNTNLIINQII